MGTFNQKVKVTCDLDNGRDKEFNFDVSVKNKQDLIETVNEGLRQKIEEGELNTQNLRDVRIKSDDKLGFFESITLDIKSLINI
jgi:hypothetical protein